MAITETYTKDRIKGGDGRWLFLQLPWCNIFDPSNTDCDLGQEIIKLRQAIENIGDSAEKAALAAVEAREVWMTEETFNLLTNDGEDLSVLDPDKTYYVYEGEEPEVGPALKNGVLTFKNSTFAGGVLTLKSPANIADGVLTLSGTKYTEPTPTPTPSLNNGVLTFQKSTFVGGTLTLKSPAAFTDGVLKLSGTKYSPTPTPTPTPKHATFASGVLTIKESALTTAGVLTLKNPATLTSGTLKL